MIPAEFFSTDPAADSVENHTGIKDWLVYPEDESRHQWATLRQVSFLEAVRRSTGNQIPFCEFTESQPVRFSR